jgi:hypothetical protein
MKFGLGVQLALSICNGLPEYQIAWAEELEATDVQSV